MKKLSLILLLLLTACVSQKPPVIIYPDDQIDADMVAFPVISSFDLVMVGDAIVHSNVYKDAYQGGVYDFTDMFELMKPVIEPYDLAFYNQETILGGTALTLSNYPRFNSPQEFGDAMVDAGFNLVSLANNHTNDTGVKAIKASDTYWKTKAAVTSGAYVTQEEADAVHIYSQNGISYGFLAYTYGINGTYLAPENQFMVDRIDLAKMEVEIKALRPLVDVLIVSVHFGSEYQNYPNSYQKNVVAKLAEWDVNIVIGNHAHAIQPITYVGDTLVYYALGNFISGQEGTAQIIGLTSSIKINKVTYGNTTTIQLSDLKVDLNYTYYDSRKRNLKIYPWDKLPTSILSDKTYWEDRFLKIVNSMGANVTFGGVEKN